MASCVFWFHPRLWLKSVVVLVFLFSWMMLIVNSRCSSLMCNHHLISHLIISLTLTLWGLGIWLETCLWLERNDLVPPLVKSAAEFMGGMNIWQDFYFLTPGLYTSANRWVCPFLTQRCVIFNPAIFRVYVCSLETPNAVITSVTETEIET